MLKKLSRYSPILICLLVALIFSSTLLMRGNAALLGTDYVAVLPFWGTWWTPHALTNNYELVFNNHSVFPIGNNQLAILSPLTSLFYSVLQTVLGVVLAYNSLVFIYCFMNSLLGYVWLHKSWGLNQRWSLVGGFVLAYNPITWSLLQAGNLALMGFFVVIAACLAWDAYLRIPSQKRAVLVAVSLYAIVLLNIQYSGFILSFCLPYALYSAWHSNKRHELIDGVLLLISCFSLFCSFYPLSALLWSSYVDLYTPIEIARLNSMTAYGNWFWIAFAMVLVAGLLALPLMTNQRRFWLSIGAIHIIFLINSELSPLAILSSILPRSDFLINPSLFAFPLILGGVLIIAAMFSQFEASLASSKQILLPILLCSVFLLLSGWSIFLPSTALNPIRDLEQIAKEPENYLIAFFPIGIVSENESFGSVEYAPLAMAYAPWHGKRVLGGVTVGDFHDERSIYENNPLLRILANYHLDDPNASVPLIRNDVERWRLAYIIVPNSVQTDTTGLRQWLSWTGTFCQIEALDSREVWRASWHPLACPLPYTIDIGATDDFYAIQAGWTAPETWGETTIRWASSEESSELIVWAKPVSDYILTVRAVALPDSQQTVTVSANGTVLGEIELGQDWQDYDFVLPRRSIDASHQISLRFEHSNAVTVDGRVLNASYDAISLRPLE